MWVTGNAEACRKVKFTEAGGGWGIAGRATAGPVLQEHLSEAPLPVV